MVKICILISFVENNFKISIFIKKNTKNNEKITLYHGYIYIELVAAQIGYYRYLNIEAIY